MRRRLTPAFACVSIAVALAAGAGACGDDGGRAADGKQVFSSAGCGTCHTLRDAGATATVGPNLDERKPSREKVDGIVRVGIKGSMPAFEGELSDAEIEAVAEYVSSATGGDT